jgi:hypothetical protein
MRTDFLNNRTVKLFDRRFLGEQRGRFGLLHCVALVVSGHLF